MRSRLSRPDIVVLLRAAALIIVIMNLSRLLEVPGVWASYKQRQTLIKSGFTSAASPGATWDTLTTTVWPVAAGVLVFVLARPIARLVCLGLPGPGFCTSCGYDLRGSPGKPCPECGQAPGVQ